MCSTAVQCSTVLQCSTAVQYTSGKAVIIIIYYKDETDEGTMCYKYNYRDETDEDILPTGCTDTLSGVVTGLISA
jgi:hypothetical protein